MSDHLVVFQGIHQTLSVEGMLRARGMEVRLVPTPPAITLGCGFSILTPDPGRDGLPGWWMAIDIPHVAYRVIIKEGRKAYEEIDRRDGADLPRAGDHDAQGSGGRRDR